MVGRRVGRRKIVPYYTRAEIEDGALDGWHLEICYLHDQVDVLFAQIQGSARIRLEDGTILRVNYDSHNGWPYTPIGRVLVDDKIMTKDQVSMQSIRDWMEANPDQAKDVRRQNKSYVFFRITDLATEDEAVGGEGVRARARPFDRDRSRAACLRHAVLHRGRLADRQRQGGNEIRPPGRSRRIPARPLSGRRAPTSISAPATRPPAWPAASRIRAISSCSFRARSIRWRLGAIRRCRRSARARSASTSARTDDPTAVDPTRNGAAAGCQTRRGGRAGRSRAESESQNAAEKMSRRRHLSDEEARAVERLCALDHAVAARQSRQAETGDRGRQARAAAAAPADAA